MTSKIMMVKESDEIEEESTFSRLVCKVKARNVRYYQKPFALIVSQSSCASIA